MALIEIRENAWVVECESVTDLLTLRPTPSNNIPAISPEYLRSSQYKSVRWFGVSGGGLGVERAVRDGWPEGRELIERSIERVDLPRLRSVRRTRVQADTGDHLDTQRVYAGDLDRAWTTTRRAMGDATRSPLTSILVNVGGNCDLEADELFWRGAVAVRACDALELSSRRTEVIAYCLSRGCSEGPRATTVLLTVRVKAFEDPVNLDQLASVTALAGFFRWYGFKGWCAIPERVTPNLGYSIQDIPSAEQLGLARQTEQLPITNIWNAEQANTFLRKLTT